MSWDNGQHDERCSVMQIRYSLLSWNTCYTTPSVQEDNFVVPIIWLLKYAADVGLNCLSIY